MKQDANQNALRNLLQVGAEVDIDLKKKAGMAQLLSGAMKLKVSQETFQAEKGSVLGRLKEKMETLANLSRKRQSQLEKDDTHDRQAANDLRLFRESVKSEDLLS